MGVERVGQEIIETIRNAFTAKGKREIHVCFLEKMGT